MSNCNECKYKKTPVQRPEPVSGHAFEVTVTALQMTIKRLVAVIIILITLLVGSNIAWVIYESQFTEIETKTFDVEQENESGDNFAVNGDMTYGETKG